jgi:hypothetical protein
MRKLVITLALLSLVATAALAADPDDVVISQAYGGGGNANGIYNRDFVELFNRTNQAIVIDGWSIQYGSATGTAIGGTSTAFQTNLQGTIQPCSWFLVAEAAGAATTQPALPGPDATGAIAMSGTTLKVFLVSNTTPLTSCTGPGIIDVVAVGPTATCYETAPTPVMANSTAANRNAATQGGYADTNNNSADFTIQTPVAHWSGSGQLATCVGDPVAAEQQTWGAVKQQYK